MLWELDGCRDGPVCHGEIEGSGLLHHAAKVIQDQFLSRSESFNFNLMALVGGCAPSFMHCVSDYSFWQERCAQRKYSKKLSWRRCAATDRLRHLRRAVEHGFPKRSS